MLLSVDTSYSNGGIALFGDKKLITDFMWSDDKSHSETLTVQFEKLIKKSNTLPSSITEVLCSHGPGSFTGLRVGMNFAKTIAHTNKINLILAPSFRSIIDIETIKKYPSHIHLVLMNAYKNQLFKAKYKLINNLLSEDLSTSTVLPQDLKIPDQDFMIWGDGFEIYKNLIPDNFKIKSIVPNVSLTDPISNPAIRQANFYFNYDHCLKFLNIDPLMAEPLYLKKSEAEENLSRGLLKKHTQRKL